MPSERGRRRPRLAAITLDLETAAPHIEPKECPLLHDAELAGRLGEVLQRHQAKLTTFVVGRVLEEAGEVVERHAAQLDPEFELHSYSHDVADPDGRSEIQRARDAYAAYFHREPMGYRAPWGRISRDGVARLAETGFKYDSSIFPSFRPGVFNNLRRPNRPFLYGNGAGGSLLELPMAAVPTLRLVVGMSYLKFFGLRFYRAAFSIFGMPDPLVFGMHLHDFKLHPEALAGADLPRWVKAYHGANVTKAMDIFEAFLAYLRRRGYSFVHMSEVYERAAKRLTPGRERLGGDGAR